MPAAVTFSVVFDFSAAPGPVREDIAASMRASWRHLARAGTWFDARERLAIAATARAARRGEAPPESDLPSASRDAAAFLAGTPAGTTESWVTAMIEALGEERYVEVLGITTRVVAIDTFCRLLGREPEPFPDPEPGEPTRIAADPRPQRSRSWVAVGELLVPPFTLSLVPDENTVTNTLVWALYMTDAEMENPDFRRGDLHRTQIELVATTVSYENECFY